MTPGQPATRPVPPYDATRLQQCGVSLCMDAHKLAKPGTCAARLHGQVVELVRSGMPAAVRLAGLCGRDALRLFYDACQGIHDAFRRSGVDARLLELTLVAGSIPPFAAWRIRRALLGNGILNVMFDALAFGDAGAASRGNVFWHDLWRLRSAPVRSTFWPNVRSASALLSPEQGTGVVPACGLQAPEQSAWMRAEFDLTAYSDEHGHVDRGALNTSIARVMDEADRTYDTASWPTSAMQHDAWYNRRLAIVLAGIGDIAKLRGLDPERHESLAVLRKLLSGIRGVVEQHSRRRALHHERLPSIAASNPCLHLPAGARESGWQRHWHAALERHAIRHRNLVALSPWSLFPSGSTDFRYANFLPLLAYADACEFQRNVSLDSWTAPQLKLFHCRAWALNDALMSCAVVADQP